MSVSRALSVQSVSHIFGDHFKALDSVSFEVLEGDFTVLLGPNGAGKTTLYSLITALYHNQTGSIEVLGHNINTNPKKALAKMGVVFQQSTLDLDLSVRQNLHYHCYLHGIPKAEANKRITTELERANLAPWAKTKVRQLSGGQRRRAEIARSLLSQPSLMLLDEPTVGLDIPSRREILAHVHKLCGDQRIAVLWASHLIDEIDEGTNVVILHKGKVRAAGSMDEVIAASKVSTIHQAFDKLTTDPVAPSPQNRTSPSNRTSSKARPTPKEAR